ncbi:MAG: response regulator [Bacteroidota bacterium]
MKAEKRAVNWTKVAIFANGTLLQSREKTMKHNSTILYVDDEADNLLAFKVLFRRKYNVVTTAEASEVLKLLQQHQIDLIISDYRMPAMTGVELLHKVAEVHPTIARFIVTGFEELEQLTDALKKGTINKVINKPWEVEELNALFSKYLGE